MAKILLPDMEHGAVMETTVKVTARGKAAKGAGSPGEAAQR